MTLFERILSLSEFKELAHEVDTAKCGSCIGSLGIIRTARLAFAAALYETLKRPILYITEKPSADLLAYDEFHFWSPEGKRSLFPAPEPLFYENASWGRAVHRDRIQILTELIRMRLPDANKKKEPVPFIIAPIRAVMTRTVDRPSFIRASKTLRVGQEIQPDALVRQWSDLGYENADTVLDSGQFSKRGGLLDIWPHSETNPIRLDFFGDEIDSISYFDPSTQRNLEKCEKVIIPPAFEVIPSCDPSVEIPIGSSPEFYLPYIHKTSACLMDYIPPKTIILGEDWDLINLFADEIEENAEALRQRSVQDGTLDPNYPAPYVSISEINDCLDRFTWLDFGRGGGREQNTALSDCFEPAKRFGGSIHQFMDYLLECFVQKESVFVASRQSRRIGDLWRDLGTDDSLAWSPVFHEQTLAGGFSMSGKNGEKAILMTDSEIFGWERPLPRKPQKQVVDAPEKYYADLKQGDYVVHIDHGIGQYDGLVSRTIDGIQKDFLVINYAEGDQLFVPVHQADRLSNYVGPDGRKPELTRLGTKDWLNAKYHVSENVIEMANELLELYAKRQMKEGFAFSPDNSWMQDLEGSFPYVETEDQKAAIQKVKEDMESTRPMDRLVCGDVGYGKTEIALRAAFKATCDSKQAAILVPTTVLAQQHYDTFRKRFAPFPIKVEMLSRFRSAKEQTAILKKLAAGEIDVIIGTHRLVSADVKFKDLGLVVIDEEQRFGVAQKEFLKKIRLQVDVLTMTATPIPRTLYMSLTGVRDISLINTPPYERVPVTTHVGPFSEKLIRQAILRERERGGQSFFVHNRVQSIYAMARYLEKLVPEVKIGIAHGQMPERQLSAIMEQFYAGDYDVLLCTSIIESGLDVPNANTLIVNRADTFGLAQLYQIRGRVGRSSQRAYAYFFRQKTSKPTEAGLERLEVIAENTQFGAGYAIAMRDLEMRGAGEMLGSRQHGAIASVGFHLYNRMLAQAVRVIRSSKGVNLSDEDMGITEQMTAILDPVTVDLSIPAGIPESYVEDTKTRIKLYRRLASICDENELQLLSDEFNDRFGPLSEPVENLFFQVRLKIIADRIGLTSITKENKSVVLKFHPLPPNVPSRNLPAIGSGIRSGKNAYWVANADAPDWRDRLLSALQMIEVTIDSKFRV